MRTLSEYQVITSLCGRDDKNPNRFNLNFRHVALAYQRYSENSHLLAENQWERSRRLKACTKIIGAVVSEVMSEYEVSPISACNHLCNAFFTALDIECSNVAG